MRTKAVLTEVQCQQDQKVSTPTRRGQWYFKVSLGKDALTGRREQITRRGYATASEAAKARRELIGKLDAGLVKPSAVALTVNELLDLYLDGLDADQRLSPKTRHDYRVYAQTYVRKPLGNARFVMSRRS